MRTKQLSVAIACVGMMFVACQKDKNPDGVQSPATLTEKEGKDVIADMFNQNIQKKTQRFEFPAQEGIEFVGAEGTIVTVHPGALHTLDGVQATGMVVAKLMEIQDNATIMLTGFPTQSRWSADNPEGGAPIQTGGAVTLKIETEDGTQLTAEGDGVTIAIPVPEGTVPDEEMTIWKGEPSATQPRDNVWEPEPNEHPEYIGQQYYLFDWDGRDKLNVDKLYTCPGTPTPFRVDLPAGFNKTNTEIYVVAGVCGSPGPKAVFSLDMYNAMPIWWTEHTAAGLPIGLTVDFVAISKINGNLMYKIENATIVSNHFQHMSGMMATTPTALAAALNAL